MILEPQKIKSDTDSTVSPSICHEVMGLDAMIFVFGIIRLTYNDIFFHLPVDGHLDCFQSSRTDVSRTIKKAKCQRMDAFALWCWRRLLRVPWTARRSTSQSLKEINPEYSLEGLMLKLKLQYFGHWR